MFLLGKLNDKPSAHVIRQIHALVGDAMKILSEPDPVLRKVAFIILAIEESTSYTERKGVSGKIIVRVHIHNPILHGEAVKMAHALVTQRRKGK